MQALARVFDDDCYSRAANDACINGGPWTRTKYEYDTRGNRFRTTKSGGEVEYTIYSSSGTMLYSYKPGNGDFTDYVYLGKMPIAEVRVSPNAPVNPVSQTLGSIPELQPFLQNPQVQQILALIPGLPPQVVDAYNQATNTAPGTSTTIYLQTDLLSSPIRIGGAIEQYDPYGVKLNGVGGEKLGYTSHVYDDNTSLVYMRARFYDPAVGRFLSSDPAGFDGSTSQTFNRYSYANNSPYVFSDPTGTTVAEIAAEKLNEHRRSYRSCPICVPHEESSGASALSLVSLLGDTVPNRKRGSRKELQQKIDQAIAKGALNPGQSFPTVEAAAVAVLKVIAPLSQDYQLEIGGNIVRTKTGFTYTKPEVGDATQMDIRPWSPGYHTHPSGGLRFSTRKYSASGGCDACWVDENDHPLYLGVRQANGSVGIAVCEPGNCDPEDLRGAAGRLVQ